MPEGKIRSRACGNTARAVVTPMSRPVMMNSASLRVCGCTAAGPLSWRAASRVLRRLPLNWSGGLFAHLHQGPLHAGPMQEESERCETQCEVHEVEHECPYHQLGIERAVQHDGAQAFEHVGGRQCQRNRLQPGW